MPPSHCSPYAVDFLQEVSFRQVCEKFAPLSTHAYDCMYNVRLFLCADRFHNPLPILNAKASFDSLLAVNASVPAVEVLREGVSIRSLQCVKEITLFCPSSNRSFPVLELV